MAPKTKRLTELPDEELQELLGLLGRRDPRPRLGQRHSRQRPDRRSEDAFIGRVLWVEIDLGEAAEDLDHLITPEEHLRLAMSRQSPSPARISGVRRPVCLTGRCAAHGHSADHLAEQY